MTTSTYIPVQRYTDEYCKALTENFKRDSMRSIEYNLKKDPNCTYSKEQLAKIVSDTANLDRFHQCMTPDQRRSSTACVGALESSGFACCA